MSILQIIEELHRREGMTNAWANGEKVEFPDNTWEGMRRKLVAEWRAGVNAWEKEQKRIAAEKRAERERVRDLRIIKELTESMVFWTDLFEKRRIKALVRFTRKACETCGIRCNPHGGKAICWKCKRKLKCMLKHKRSATNLNLWKIKT